MTRSRQSHRTLVREDLHNYRRCGYRGLWQPCCCLTCGCCKDPLKCGCVIIGIIILLEIIPLLVCCIVCALQFESPQLHMEFEEYKSQKVLTVILYVIPILFFLVEGILILIGVLCRIKNLILVTVILGIIFWILTQLLVVITSVLYYYFEVTYFLHDTGSQPAGHSVPWVEDDFVYSNFWIFSLCFYFSLYFWPYFMVCLAVLYKRHRELGSGDMVKNDVL